MRCAKPPLFAAMCVLLGSCACAQDSRHVNEPKLPPPCAVLIANRTAPDPGRSDDQQRIQQALNACPTGHAVHLAASNELSAFLSGPIKLPSGVTLVVDAGATLYASTDAKRYDRGRGSCGSLDKFGQGCSPFITAEDTEDSGVMGAGAIDGQGGKVISEKKESWWQLARRAQAEALKHNVPRLLEVNHSKSFTLHQIRLRNAPGFHVTLHGVDGFTAWGIRIDSPSDARNTDGIDPISSRNITVTHSHIRTGDDSIAIKASAAGPSQNMSIVDNHFYNGHGMSIGSETLGGVSRVEVKQLTMDGSTSGLRIKSDSSAGGRVEDIRYSDVCMRGVKRPIEITARYNPLAQGTSFPTFENIFFESIRSVTPGEVVIIGAEHSPPIHTVFKEVRIAGPNSLRVRDAEAPSGIDFVGSGRALAMDCSDRFEPFPESEVRSFRPQLSEAEVEHYSLQQVLGHAGPPGREALSPWIPVPDAVTQPDYVVDQSLSVEKPKAFRTVQAAIHQAVRDARASASRQRIFIAIQPGYHPGLVYVPALDAPITLYGTGEGPGATVLSASLDASLTGELFAQRHGAQFLQADAAIRSMFEQVRSRPVITTFGTATLWTRNAGFHARNLTVENAYVRDSPQCVEDCKAATPQVMHQAVALMVDGADKSQFERIRLLGLQDTLYLKSREGGVTSRSYFADSYIEGDVDFIFGDATAFFLRTEIKSLGRRKDSYVAAPSTPLNARYGFVFDQCQFTHDGSETALSGNFRLARQWFHNQRCTPFGTPTPAGYSCVLGDADAYPEPRGTIRAVTLGNVGKMLVMHSTIGAHISRTNPWADWNQSGKLSFRPVQFDVAEFLKNLNAAFPGSSLESLGFSQEPVLKRFLAEYKNK